MGLVLRQRRCSNPVANSKGMHFTMKSIFNVVKLVLVAYAVYAVLVYLPAWIPGLPSPPKSPFLYPPDLLGIKAPNPGPAVSEAIERIVFQTKNAGGDIAHEAKRAGGDIARETKQAAGDIARETKQAAGDVARETKQAGGDVARESKNAASEVKKAGGNVAKEAKKIFGR